MSLIMAEIPRDFTIFRAQMLFFFVANDINIVHKSAQSWNLMDDINDIINDVMEQLCPQVRRLSSCIFHQHPFRKGRECPHNQRLKQ